MDAQKLRYTEDHEWIGADGGVYTVGITEFAQEQLGDITYVELPKVGREFAAHDEAATVESVKAASDVYAPVGGRVVEVNDALDAEPELVNKEPLGAGWFFKMEVPDADDINGLMDYAEYQKYIAGLAH